MTWWEAALLGGAGGLAWGVGADLVAVSRRRLSARKVARLFDVPVDLIATPLLQRAGVRRPRDRYSSSRMMPVGDGGPELVVPLVRNSSYPRVDSRWFRDVFEPGVADLIADLNRRMSAAAGRVFLERWYGVPRSVHPDGSVEHCLQVVRHEGQVQLWEAREWLAGRVAEVEADLQLDPFAEAQFVRGVG